MENSRKFSKPPSSLNFSRKPDNGSGSSASTPSDDYKTPSLEHAPIPGFEFGSREGEPEPATRLQQLMQNTSGGHTWTTGFRLEPVNQNTDSVPRSLRSAGVSASMKPVFGADDRISNLAGGYGSMVNGATPKSVVSGPAPVGTLRHSSEANVVPLLRSPQTPARQTKKTTTFAALPNQTTWLKETTQRGSSLERDAAAKSGAESARNPGTELSGIRMKLEERRKQMESEKKRMEMQWTKQRQQVGKEAFIQVVTKNQLGSSSQTDLRDTETTERPSFFREMSDGSLMTHHKQQERKNVLSGSSEGRIETKSEFLPEKKENGKRGAVDGAAEPREAYSNPAKPTRPAMQLDLLNANDAKQRTKVVEESGKRSAPVSDREGEPPPPGGDVSEYSTSLDRLNCSLTELQGEIMRLSLQQDQIKSLVGTELETATAPTPKSYPVITTQSSKEQFYLFPRNAVVDSNAAAKRSTSTSVYGSTVSSIYGSASSSLYGSTVSSVSVSSPVAKPPSYGAPLSASGMAPHGSSYPGPMPSVYANLQGPYPHYFPPPPQANNPYAIGGHYSMPLANPNAPPVSSYPGHLHHHHFPDHGHVNYPPPGVGIYPGGWQAPVHSQMHGASAPSHPQKPPSSEPHSDAFTFHPSAVAPPQVSSSTPKTPQQVPHPASLYGLHNSDPINYNPTPRSVAPSTSTSLPSPRDFIASPSSSSPPGSRNIPSELDEAPTATPPAPSQAFFMVLDPDLPRRPKPALGNNYRRKDAEGSGPARPNSTPSAYESSPSTVTAVTSGDAAEATVTAETGAFDANPSVGFVIGEEENCMDELLQQEVEKKRQRLAELHQKRRDELEMKKQKIEVEQQTKREALRVKQEMSDQKKADEKARREAIFQNYLQRKAEEDGSEDDVRAASHANSKRQNAAKQRTPRPKSQPPPATTGGNLNEESRSYNTPGSIGSQLTDPRTASPASDLSKSSERLNIMANFEQLEARLASLSSQRTPSLSDRVPRFVSSSSDGGSETGGVVVGGNQLPDNYAGPKLFVKPSQKSNRHIIINAIKDCCLAGLVNQDAKNRVLEEINKSESKHFVILFRDAGMQYRGLYTYNPDREDVFKIHGVGPSRLLDKMMEKFYKYNSGAKNFSEVTSTKHLSATIDAIAILGSLWQKKPPTGGAQAQGKRPV